MNKIKDHVIAISIFILTLVLCPLCIGFCEKYSDYTYFINFIFSLIIIVSSGLRLFGKINTEKFVSIISCDLILIIAANNLYSFSKLMQIKNNFNFHSTYMGMIKIVVFSIAILVIMKLFLWANEKDKLSRQNNNINNTPKNGGAATSSASNTNSDCNNPQRETNSYIYMIIISIIAILGVIGAVVTVYIFRKPISDGTWIESVPYLLLVIGVAIGFLILLNILIFFAKLIVDLIRYRDERHKIMSNTLSNYRLSITITSILFVVIFLLKDDLSIDSFTNLVSEDLGNWLALPLSFSIVLAAFFVVVWLIQVILKVFSVPVNKFPPDKITEIWDKMYPKFYDIAKKIYSIIIDTIMGAIEFAEFIPDYFQTLKILVIGDEEDNNEGTVSSPNESNTSANESGGNNA